MEVELGEQSLFSKYYQREYEKRDIEELGRRYMGYQPLSDDTTSSANDFTGSLARTIARLLLVPTQLLSWEWSSCGRFFILIVGYLLRYVVLPVIVGILIKEQWDRRKVYADWLWRLWHHIRYPVSVVSKALHQSTSRFYYSTRYNFFTDRAYLYWQQIIFTVERSFWRGCFLVILLMWMQALLVRPILLESQSFSPTGVWGHGDKVPRQAFTSASVVPTKVQLTDRLVDSAAAVITQLPRSQREDPVEKRGQAVESTELEWCFMCQQLHCCNVAS